MKSGKDIKSTDNRLLRNNIKTGEFAVDQKSATNDNSKIKVSGSLSASAGLFCSSEKLAKISNMLQRMVFLRPRYHLRLRLTTIRTAVLILVLVLTLTQAGPLFAGLSGVSAETQIDRWGMIAGSTVNMRSAASTSSDIVVSLSLGSRVKVISQLTGEAAGSYGDQWYKVEHTTSAGKLYQGYIVIPLVQLDPEVPVNDEYDAQLEALGFPASYWPYLRVLHEKYPEWVFTPMMIDAEYDWDKILDEQSRTGRSLIPHTYSNAQKSYASDAYRYATDTWIMHDSNEWVMANRETIAYYLDPRNWLGEMYVFMFENLKYNPEIHVRSGVASILAGGFMADGLETFTYQQIGMDNRPVVDGAGNPVLLTSGHVDAFMEAAALTGVCPYHLASRSALEIGKTKSGSVTGTYGDPYNGLYNYYNIGASQGIEPIRNGLEYAKYGPGRKPEQTATDDKYLIPWDSPWRSIVGGAVFIGSAYINRNQHTLYLQKFDLDDAYDGVFWHQYMGNLMAPMYEGNLTFKAYRDQGQLQNPFEFVIPVISGLPEQPAPLPVDARSRNNWLKTLGTDGIAISPTFDPAITEYTSTVDHTVQAVTISGTPVNAKAVISGSGTYNLMTGVNTISLTVTSESGEPRVYKLTITKKADDGSVPDQEVEPQDPIPALEFSQQVIKVSDQTITGLDPRKSLNEISQFTANLGVSAGYQVQVHNPAGEPIEEGLVGTGSTVTVSYNDLVTQSFTVVLYGDVNGDGRISSADLNLIFNHVLQKSSLSGAGLTAADVDRNSKVSSADLNSIFNHVLQKTSLQQ